MLDKLSHDILFEIYKHAGFASFARLKIVSRALNEKITNLEEYIVTDQAKQLYETPSKKHIYTMIDTFGQQNYQSPINKFVKYIWFLSMYPDLTTYQKHKISYLVSFYTEQGCKSTVARHFLENVLKYRNSCCLTMDQLYSISFCVIDICALKKLFGIRVLDLKNTYLQSCCDRNICSYDNISEICLYKYYRRYDDLLCHNYQQIKMLLAKQCPLMLQQMLHAEVLLVNRHIYIRDPTQNNRNIRYTIDSWERILNFYMYYGKYNSVQKLYNYICHKQRQLLKKYFS